MATIFGILVVFTPIAWVVANLDRVIDFVKAFIRWHFHD
jgi:hypothetical protein